MTGIFLWVSQFHLPLAIFLVIVNNK